MPRPKKLPVAPAVKRNERGHGDGTIREVRPGVWRAWRTPTNGKRPSRTFTSEAAAAIWARGEPETPVLYLGQWLERWLALRAPTLRPNTLRNYERFVAACGPLLLKPLADIDEEHWQRHVNSLTEVWSRKHVVAWKGIISAAISAAVPRYATANTLSGARLPKAVEDPPKAWTLAEVGRLIAAADGLTHHTWLCVALGTGMRLGELRALLWEDVDLRAKTITVRRSMDNNTDEIGPTKSGRIRRVDIPDELVPILVSHRARQRPGIALVFGQGKRGRPIRAASYRRWLWTHCRRAGVTPLSPHSTRHTFVSLALDEGTPIQDIARALGHASITTTQSVYAHFIGEGQRRAANAVGRALFGAKPTHLHADLHASESATR